MAVVYLAEHQLLQSKVAIKVLKREFVHNENIRKRFISEARNMFKMSHPNIVRVTDMVEEDQTVALCDGVRGGRNIKGLFTHPTQHVELNHHFGIVPCY
jgi:serine/threonine protein kinase